jgi:hypothetical protein
MKGLVKILLAPHERACFPFQLAEEANSLGLWRAIGAFVHRALLQRFGSFARVFWR